MKVRIARCRRWGGVFLLGLLPLLGGGVAAVATPPAPPATTAEIRPPRLIDHSSPFVPMALRSLNLRDPAASALVRVGRTGEVVDLVVIEATHRGLIAAAERVLRGAEYEPGAVDGVATVMDLRVKIEFSQPQAVPQSVTDHVEATIERLQSTGLDYVLATPRELDEPLAMIAEGPRVVPVDPSGNVIPGRAVLEFYVDRTGTPRMPEVVSSDHAQITAAAVQILETLRFAPPLRDAQPTLVKVRMPFDFAAPAAPVTGN